MFVAAGVCGMYIISSGKLSSNPLIYSSVDILISTGTKKSNHISRQLCLFPRNLWISTYSESICRIIFDTSCLSTHEIFWRPSCWKHMDCTGLFWIHITPGLLQDSCRTVARFLETRTVPFVSGRIEHPKPLCTPRMVDIVRGCWSPSVWKTCKVNYLYLVIHLCAHIWCPYVYYCHVPLL